MLFSSRTKNEVARLALGEECCRLAELSALVRTEGIIQIRGLEGTSLSVASENAAVARRVFTLIKDLFNFNPQIMVKKRIRLKKNNVYVVHIPSELNVRNILHKLGIMGEESEIKQGIPKSLIKRRCCKRAYVRGAFLGKGYVADPEKMYHLEISSENKQFVDEFSSLLAQFGIKSGIAEHKDHFVIYLKDGEQIVELLRVIGADAALLNFENVRIVKSVRNRVNRIVNCETANLEKAVDAALRQLEDIRLIDEKIGLEKLPKSLREISELRLKNPSASLKELGDSLTPPVGKSGVNHRMRKISEIADELRSKHFGV